MYKEFLLCDFVVCHVTGWMGVCEVAGLALCSKSLLGVWGRVLRTLVGRGKEKEGLFSLFLTRIGEIDVMGKRGKVSLPEYETPELSINPPGCMYNWDFTVQASGTEAAWLSRGTRKSDGKKVIVWMHHVPCGTVTSLWLAITIAEGGGVEWAVQLAEVDPSESPEKVTIFIGSPQRACAEQFKRLKTPDGGVSTRLKDYCTYNVLLGRGDGVQGMASLGQSAAEGRLKSYVESSTEGLLEYIRESHAPSLYELDSETKTLVTHKGIAKYTTGTCTPKYITPTAFHERLHVKAQWLIRYATKHETDMAASLQLLLPHGILAWIPIAHR
eukprot:TRINITY_DN21431_c0_g1_i1.p1 TRINITY_DN21431_c0_g1~~TRINITY_DN21431_c0_g1_i1.p1  ORF type:complete len:357 (+),score=39.51 TRINITY_DN21431_c0_g1_i1:90-1073(+)